MKMISYFCLVFMDMYRPETINKYYPKAINKINSMRTMSKILLGAWCAAAFAFPVFGQEKSNPVVANGVSFLGTPYVAHTLEGNPTEELVINCDEVDCVTFVEYVLAYTLAPTEDNQVAEGDFADCLQKIRYRDGKIDGYASRLHYATDWIDNGIRNGFLEDVTARNTPYVKTLELSYMSNHADQYRQLAASAKELARIKDIEKSLTGREVHYLPKEQLPYEGLFWIKNGDLIAITTNIPGLDIAHWGIAFYADGKLSLLHASSTEKKVVVSKVALAQMLKGNEKWTGIRVLRMKK